MSSAAVYTDPRFNLAWHGSCTACGHQFTVLEESSLPDAALIYGRPYCVVRSTWTDHECSPDAKFVADLRDGPLWRNGTRDYA